MIQRTDPSAESPAGVIYQIPLDSARRDAAPVLPSGRRDGGAGHSATGAAGPGAGAGDAGSGGAGGARGGSTGGVGAGLGGSVSAGSTAGASRGSAGTGAGLRASSGSETAGGNGGTSQDPSSIHSENGFGSSSQVPGLSQAALRTGAGVTSTQTAGSIMPTYLLIALIAAAAIGMGLLATRRPRGHDDPRSSAGSPPPAAL